MLSVMTEHSRFARSCWLLGAILQLLVGPVAAIADARLESESLSPRAVSHIESHGTKQCPRAHPADCALCQQIASSLSVTAAQAGPQYLHEAIAILLPEFVAADTSEWRSLQKTRGPPTA
jgi:hypothetical protein